CSGNTTQPWIILNPAVGRDGVCGYSGIRRNALRLLRPTSTLHPRLMRGDFKRRFAILGHDGETAHIFMLLSK
ncbi:MAG: hypothetical protein ABI659_03395, partial [Nitrosospira sp.]